MAITRSAKARPATQPHKPTSNRRSVPAPRTVPIPSKHSLLDSATTTTKSRFSPKQHSLALQHLHHLVSRTVYPRTICPSQLARRLPDVCPDDFPPGSSHKGQEGWRDLMNPVREVVWECVGRDWVEVCQGGVTRTLAERDGLKGPIRVRKGARWDDWAPPG